jgi:hypothetical protein
MRAEDPDMIKPFAFVSAVKQRMESGTMSDEQFAKAIMALMMLADAFGIGLGLLQGDSGVVNQALGKAIGRQQE